MSDIKQTYATSVIPPNFRPFLGADEIDNRLKYRYKGGHAKKRVKGNINYLDNNILGLENRYSLDIGRFSNTEYQSVGKKKALRRSKSICYESIRNFNRTSKIPLKQELNTSYDEYRKVYSPYDIVRRSKDKLLDNSLNKMDNPLLDYSMLSLTNNSKVPQTENRVLQSEISMQDKRDMLEYLSSKDILNDPREYVKHCKEKEVSDYNIHATELKVKELAFKKRQERIEELENEAIFIVKKKEEIEKEIRSKFEKIRKEREALEISKQNALVVKKKEKEDKKSLVNQYDYIKLGKDHQRETELKKELSRERRRQAIQRNNFSMIIQRSHKKFLKDERFIRQLELDKKERKLPYNKLTDKQDCYNTLKNVISAVIYSEQIDI